MALKNEIIGGGNSEVGEAIVLSFPGPPTTGYHVENEEIVDSFNGIWQCVKDGTPGTWVQIANGSGSDLP